MAVTREHGIVRALLDLVGARSEGKDATLILPQQPPALLERADEIARLEAAIGAAASGRGGVIFIEGPAGIGKSALLEQARRVAEDRKLIVLTAQGGDVERDFVYGIVRELFDPVVRRGRIAGLLNGAAAQAAPVLGLAPTTAPDPLRENADPLFAALHGLYWLTSNLAEQTPLAILVDDCHWGDVASLRFLHYMGKRVQDLPVLLVLAARRADSATPEGDLLQEITGAGAALLLPAPLSLAATQEILEAQFGVRPAAAYVEACNRVTGGNPYLLRELARSAATEGVPPTEDQASRVERIVPQSIGRAVLLRLARLSEDARRLAKVMAVLEEEPMRGLARRVAGLDRGTAAAAVDALVASDILGHDPGLAFAHPIVREVIHAEMPAGELSLLHAEAARLLHESDAPPDKVAAHLLASGPGDEQWAEEVLRRAAVDALSGGTPQLAVAYLRRALDEAASSRRDSDLWYELGRAEVAAGDQRAAESLATARDLAEDTSKRARIALELGQTIGLAGDIRNHAAALRDAIDLAAQVEPDLALRVEAHMIGVARLVPESRDWATTRLRDLGSRITTPSPTNVVLLANLALDALEQGRPAALVAELAERALEGGWLWGESWQYSYAANVLTWTDHFDAAHRAWDFAINEVGRAASPVLVSLAYTMRAHLRIRTGDLLEAESDATIAAAIVQDYDWYDWGAALPYIAAFKADSLIERDLSAVPALVDRTGEWEEQIPFFLDTRARYRLTTGDANGALEDFLTCGRALETRGGRDSPGIVPWRSGASSALRLLGDLKEATRVAHEELGLARAVGSPRAVALALRACGLSTPHSADSLLLLKESVELLEGSGASLDHARALVDVGMTLRRLRRPGEAREPLKLGLDIAHRCGATILAESARHELVAAGGRPRRAVISGVDALTPTERRVAELVSTGMSNREVAQSLFVSMRTVAVHLTHVYQKLGIEGREQLPEALTRRP